jgi:tetratricopeptide (TPR) repeat protein
MKSLRRIAVWVCLVAIQAVAQEVKQSWLTLHQAGYNAFDAGRYAEALENFRASSPLALSPIQRAMTLRDIGYSLSRLGQNVEALAEFELALDAWRSIDPAGHLAAETAVEVAYGLQGAARFGKAERTLLSALDASPREKSDNAAILNALGDLFNGQSRFVQARQKFEAALKLSSAADNNRINALTGLGAAERPMRQWQAAIAHLNDALALSIKTKQATHEAAALLNLGNTYADMGDFGRAEPLLKRALAIFATGLTRPVQYAETLACLGVVYDAERKLALAENAFMDAMKADGGFGAPNTHSAKVLELLSALRLEQKRFTEAAEFANQAYGMLKSAFGDNSPSVAGALASIALVEERSGEPEAAERHYSEALHTMRENGILSSESALGMMYRYANVLQKLHRTRDANAVKAQVKALRPATQPVY